MVLGCLIELSGIFLQGPSRKPSPGRCAGCLLPAGSSFPRRPPVLASTRKPSVRFISTITTTAVRFLQPGKHLHLGAKIAADLDFLPMDPAVFRQRRGLRAFGFENEGVCGKDHPGRCPSLSVNFTYRVIAE